MSKCIERKAGFSQVCVMPGTTLTSPEGHSTTVEDFEATVMEWTGCRVQFLEEITTNPDYDEFGQRIKHTGGRTDLIFAVHQDDIPKFAVKRFAYSISWFEDVVSKANRGEQLYPEYAKGYATW